MSYERVSAIKALIPTAIGIAEPLFRSIQHGWAQSSAVRAVEKFGVGSPQLNSALERLDKVSQNIAAHPSALVTVPFVFAGEVIEPDPDRSVPWPERLGRYGYLFLATHAVTVAPTLLNELIGHIKEKSDITMQPEMLWIPVAAIALLRSGSQIYKKVTFANLEQRRLHKKVVLDRSHKRLAEETKPPTIRPSKTAQEIVEEILQEQATRVVDRAEANAPENTILREFHARVLRTLRQLRGIPDELPPFIQNRKN